MSAIPATPASSITYEGKIASEMLAEVREWDKQEKAAGFTLDIFIAP
ncbi:MAG: hypothetical protein OI860_00755 (plasmid) [Candidatus Methanoperedens sp.]|nr:hypothetical protein [Candidatus Methanoperedens sp. BLZ2]MBZ0175612.1 hypothetical protein [Candidatus Methanoperedens nitroreducens]WAH95116.1 MAG: hypothetical protein OI863_00560 [Candidatus Methanoperedens sp.]WAM22324.1 MAG: hypothetical protein OI860_00755 [Candidatus Methanoperedens sp.]